MLMNEKFVYATPEEQIAKLKSKGLFFENQKIAKDILNIYGYYNVINTYKEPYILIQNDGAKKYKPGTTFNQIFSIFTLDHCLRIAIMMSMLDVEELLRASLADVIAESFGADHHVYLNPKNYRNRYIRDPRFSLKAILSSMNETIVKSDKNPLAYYRDTYGVIPPWVLFKNVYLATLVNFVRQLKSSELTSLIVKIYGIDKDAASLPFVTHLFFDTLHICREYRNIAAHGGRIYNAVLKSKCRIPESDEIHFFAQFRPHIQYLPSSYGLNQLCILLSLFAYSQPERIIYSEINKELQRHCYMYPQDSEFLAKSLGGTIYIRNY